MGTTDSRGIYHPSLAETGWDDEMDANLTALARAKLVSSRDRLAFGHRRSGAQVDGIYALADGLKKTEITTANFYIASFTEHVGSSEYALYDPDGWVYQSSRVPNGEWNMTKPAGASLNLPEGVYAWQGYVQLDGAVNPNTELVMWMAYEKTWFGALYDGGWSSPHLAYTAPFTSFIDSNGYTGYESGLFWAAEDDTPALLALTLRNAPATLKITFLTFAIVKVAG